MHRLFWLMVGIGLGAWAYRYFVEQGGQIPGFEPLGEQGRRLTERGREFAASGRQFAETGRQLAQEGRQFAQTAMDTAQTRGRDVMDTMKARASKLQQGDFSGVMREDVREEESGEQSGS